MRGAGPTRTRVVGTLAAFALAAGAWLLVTAEPLPAPEIPVAPPRAAEAGSTAPSIPMPPPFAQRQIREPAPDDEAPSPTAAYCADSNWSRMEGGLAPVATATDGEFAVDGAAWTRALSGTRAGLASWASQCRHGGAPVRIVAADGGALLATYDPASGLRSERSIAGR